MHLRMYATRVCWEADEQEAEQAEVTAETAEA